MKAIVVRTIRLDSKTHLPGTIVDIPEAPFSLLKAKGHVKDAVEAKPVPAADPEPALATQ